MTKLDLFNESMHNTELKYAGTIDLDKIYSFSISFEQHNVEATVLNKYGSRFETGRSFATIADDDNSFVITLINDSAEFKRVISDVSDALKQK